jgi:hypothetical protein
MVAAAAADCRGDMAETQGGSIGPDLLEKWALGYLERFASSAENLRRVLRRRVRRRTADNETAQRAAALIDEGRALPRERADRRCRLRRPGAPAGTR